MSYCKVIKEKYRPYLGEVVPYGHGFVWKGYYLSDSKLRHHGVSFSQTTAFVPDEERESILNKYLIRHEKSLRAKSLGYYSTSASNWGSYSYTTTITYG